MDNLIQETKIKENWDQPVELPLSNNSKNIQHDPVNHPAHYNMHKFESIEEMEIVFGPEAVATYCKLNAWKYRNRAPYKGKFEEDNDKADWYLAKAKELQEKIFAKKL